MSERGKEGSKAEMGNHAFSASLEAFVFEASRNDLNDTVTAHIDDAMVDSEHKLRKVFLFLRSKFRSFEDSVVLIFD